MEIFNYEDYKSYVRDFVTNQPRKGYGQWTKMANHLGIHNVVLSQIFRGPKELSFEQAFNLSEFLGLTDLEREYFLILVHINRSGNYRLKNYLKDKLNEIQKQSMDLKNRLTQDKELTEETRAMFYSNWYFSGIRLATDLPDINSIETLARKLNLPLHTVRKVVDFLLENKLIIREKNKLKFGPSRIHVGTDSPLSTRHAINWRLKAVNQMDSYNPQHELFFTGPFALSRELLGIIRKRLVYLVDECTQDVVNSSSETLACLNIDWFQVRSDKY